VILSLAAAFLVALCSNLAAWAQDRVLTEWSFDTPGDLEGWRPNGHLADVQVADGLLKGKVIDWDPFLTSSLFEIETAPWQRIDVRMKGTQNASCEFFWTNTEETEYEGFSPGKETHFSVIGDGEFHVYPIHPFWHAEGKIIKLRFDLFRDDGEFEIDWIRVVDPGPPPSRDDAAWTFDGGDLGGWTAATGVERFRFERDYLAGQTTQDTGLLLGPALSVPLEGRLWVSLRMRVSGGRYGFIRYATQEQSGLRTRRFPLRAANRIHTYNLDMGDQKAWQGTLLALGLQPTDKPDARFRVYDIRVSTEPTGAPDVGFRFVGLMEAPARAGRPVTVSCVLENHGGEPAEDVRVRLEIEGRPRLAPDQAAEKTARIDFAVPETVSWRIFADEPCRFTPRFHLAVPGQEPQTEMGKPLTIGPPLDVAPADYVPEPRPVETDYLVGTYYFPGWYAMSRWRCIQDIAPGRKPILGWYNEADPECVDWQIKWAVEHGISIFMVDWYWTAGARSLEHWLHDGYMKARYRKYLKFALMWANHNRPGTHSLEDWRNVTQYWIDNYFGLPEYLQIDGKPAVFIWAPANIRRDLGGSEEAAKLCALSQQMARDAGYPGVTFVAMGSHGDDAQVAQLVSEGYAGATTYHWWGDALKLAKDPMFFAFDLVAQTSKAAWERHDEMIADRLLYIPTVDTGWDSQPWHGDDARRIYGRTPERFEKLCRDAKDFVDRRGRNIIALGPCNEWGEGSYIEPCAEYGFGMYEAIRRVFSKPGEWPPSVAPVDVSLGPYDFPQAEKQTAWQFQTEGDGEGWAPMMGMGGFRVEGGAMHCITSGSDPAFAGPVVNVSAQRYPRILIRFSIDRLSMPNESAQLFWETATSEISEANSIRVELIGDGEYHDYVLDVGQSDRWRGAIRGFRLDPGGTDGANVAVDAIRLLE
jgi:hypothetical protein